jgi:hypothetical protein
MSVAGVIAAAKAASVDLGAVVTGVIERLKEDEWTVT